MSKQVQSAKRAVLLINTTIMPNKNASPVELDVPLAPPKNSAQLAPTLPSLLAVVSAPTVPTPAPPATALVPAQLVSVGSSTSKVPAKLPAHLAHPLSTESANALQALSLKVNVSPVAVQASPQSIVYVSPATPTVLNVKALSIPVLLALLGIESMLPLPPVFQLPNAPMANSTAMEHALLSAIMDSSTMRVFASTEDVSVDTKLTDSEDV
jgi:hypothetical protein